jgi:integrase
MRTRRNRPGQIGDFWLSRRPNSPAWCRTWFHADSRQTKRESLGVENFDEAFQLLSDWYAQHRLKRAEPDETKLADIFLRYWTDHAEHIRSASSAKVHLRVALELMDGDPLVSDFGIVEQEALIKRLRDRYSDGTVKRYFGSVASAIRWAWKRELITNHRPLVDKLSKGDPQRCPLTIAELARLWDAADLPHMRAFIMVMMCCACRPEAALQLTRRQCENGLVDLNGGRRRTKKRRPIIPMVAPLKPWVMATSGHLVEFEGRPIKSVKTAWAKLRERAGFGLEVSPMLLRHTMGTQLAARGVPKWQRECFMGHSADNTTGRHYEHSHPDFLKEAREAIESVVNEMGEAATSPMCPINPNVRATCVLAV